MARPTLFSGVSGATNDSSASRSVTIDLGTNSNTGVWAWFGVASASGITVSDVTLGGSSVLSDVSTAFVLNGRNWYQLRHKTALTGPQTLAVTFSTSGGNKVVCAVALHDLNATPWSGEAAIAWPSSSTTAMSATVASDSDSLVLLACQEINGATLTPGSGSSLISGFEATFRRGLVEDGTTSTTIDGTWGSATQYYAGVISVRGIVGGGGATAVTLTGPTSGTSGVASTNFTVGLDGTPPSGDTIVTPSDGGDGGTFTPTTVTINSGSPASTFTYTPASTGTKTISVTNDGGLTNPSSISYTSNAAADPPVITGQPSNATVKRGQTATFTVTATGSGTVTYQWQRNPGGVGSWANISGATSASYTTPATTISGGSANDQDDYRCNVSDDDAGPVATDVVTLTVQQATLALNAAGYEIADGNSPATAAIDASVAWEIEVINDALPPVSVYHSDSVTTSAAGRLADISDDELIYGTTYTVLGRRVSDGEWFAFTITAT